MPIFIRSYSDGADIDENPDFGLRCADYDVIDDSDADLLAEFRTAYAAMTEARARVLHASRSPTPEESETRREEIRRSLLGRGIDPIRIR